MAIIKYQEAAGLEVKRGRPGAFGGRSDTLRRAGE